MPNREEKDRFSMMIMQMAVDKRIDHMDAVTTYCELNNMEIKVAAQLVNSTLKSLIEGEAIEMKYLPSTSRLPT